MRHPRADPRPSRGIRGGPRHAAGPAAAVRAPADAAPRARLAAARAEDAAQ